MKFSVSGQDYRHFPLVDNSSDEVWLLLLQIIELWCSTGRYELHYWACYQSYLLDYVNTLHVNTLQWMH